jgi:hypothetical protein
MIRVEVGEQDTQVGNHINPGDIKDPCPGVSDHIPTRFTAYPVPHFYDPIIVLYHHPPAHADPRILEHMLKLMPYFRYLRTLRPTPHLWSSTHTRPEMDAKSLAKPTFGG